METKYEKEVREIIELTDSIISKSKAFAERNVKNQNFQDLEHVVEELREINAFIN